MTQQIIDSDLGAAMLAKVRARLAVDEATGCWNWTGATNHGGYGVHSVTVGYRKRKQYRVHRLTYELLVGPIPGDLTIDHLCRNRVCANPAHLEPVTASENVRRGMANIVACKYGHPFDEINTFYRLRPDGYTQRVCRACARVNKLAAYHAKKARSA